MGANKSSKPTPLRGANHMAGKACHALRTPTQRGLTLALGGRGKFMRSAALLSLVLVAGCASAPPPTLDDIALRVAGEASPSCEAGHERALFDGSVTIRPGQTICVTVQVEGHSVIPTAVVPSADSGNTLVLKFWQEPGTGDSVLTVHNPLATFLSYKAHMLRARSSRSEYTSSCPVLSKRFGLEHWPYAIAELKLSGFESLPESETITCR